DKIYFRRVQLCKTEPMYQYLSRQMPHLLEDSIYYPNTAIITFAIQAPENAVTRMDETALQFLERIKTFFQRWIVPGHRSGTNRNNISATISIADDEWDEVGNWLWENRDCYNGLSFLQKSNITYKQTPFESCSYEQWLETNMLYKEFDIRQVKEEYDSTDFIS